jgi:ribose transport system ATP-binding protein
MPRQSSRSAGAPALTGGTTPSEGEAAVVVQGISKVYPGTRALDHVDLELRRGEVHGLCGGNGSGKSTLIKILSGALQADGGTIRIGGHELDAAQVRHKAAYDLGIRVVHQDLGLFPDLSIAENMMLGAAYPMAFPAGIRWGETRRRAGAHLDRLAIPWDPQTLVRDLPIAARTQVAIARALQDIAAEQGVIILDEPTAALPAHEVQVLLDAIRRLAADGHAVLFVSHRLNEVLALTDRVTVLRDGRVFAEHRTATLTEGELIKSIIGRDIEGAGNERVAAVADHSMLSIAGLWAGPLQGIDLDVRAGEVVGIAGLLGSGRSELLRAVYGDLPKTAGTVTVNGRPAQFTRIDQAIAAGVVMIQEDRGTEGVFADLTVDENMDVSVLGRYWGGIFRRQRMRRDSGDLRGRFSIKAPSGSVLMQALSGGNQQKTILARWLRCDPVLLLLDEPAQGVDVGARADIYTAVRRAADSGGAALVVASDLEELAQVVDRAVVLRNGRIVAHAPRAELSAFRLNELIYAESEKSGA